MIDLLICGREDGAFKEELVLSIGLVNAWINDIDQTLSIILSETHVIRQLDGFIWSEVRSITDFEEPLCE